MMSDEIPSKMETTKKPTGIESSISKEKMHFDDLKSCMDSFFNDREYQIERAYKTGFSAVISEDYTKIDLVCNLTDILYNMCSSDPDMTPEEKKNFKTLCNGIGQLNKSLKQYDKKTTSEFVAVIAGYILKLIRNNLHD
jgi:hypothetical protein